jgi:DNA-binding NarL/FixJ family response regulator
MPNLSNTVTFLFAGDGSLASDGLSAFLQTKSNFLLLSECSDGKTAIAEILSHQPEIAVIDAQLPDMSAREIVDGIRTKNRGTKIIVLGATADRHIANELISAGADAYIVRSGPSRQLNDAIRYVRDGGKYLAPQLTTDLPVSAVAYAPEIPAEAFSSLRVAVEGQDLTVQRLEQAMGRAQHAIELLQQKVERLTSSPLEHAPGPHADESEHNRRMPSVRTALSAVAATLVLAVLGFQFAGILRPASVSQIATSATLSNANTTTPVTGWEWENVEHARTLLANQQYQAAEKLCRTVLKQHPGDTAATKILASALFHQDRVSESADVVRTLAVPNAHTTQSP